MKATTLPSIGWAQNIRIQNAHRARERAVQSVTGLFVVLAAVLVYGVVDLNDRRIDAEQRARLEQRQAANAGTRWRQCIDANDPTIQRLTHGNKVARKDMK